MPTTYKPRNQMQLKDGGNCPSKDCVPTSFATVTDLATAGRTVLRPPSIRNAAGVSCTSGLTQQQAANGVKALTGLTWTPRYSLNRQQVLDAIQVYGAVEISLAYRRILSYSFRNSTSFTGGHGTVVIGVHTKDGQLRFTWGDPLADGRLMWDGKNAHVGFQDVPASVILAAAEDRGGGVINIGIPPSSRHSSRRATSTTPLWSSPWSTATVKRTIATGTPVTVRRPVAGRKWEIGTKSGTGWWEIERIDGKLISPYLYAAAGRLK